MPNKAELIDAISEKADISKAAAGASLDTALGEIAEALKKGERVSISGFGTFSVRSIAAHLGRNPQTGATIQIAASKRVAFKAGKALKDSVQ